MFQVHIKKVVMAERNKQKSWQSAINSYCQTLLLRLIPNDENL